MLAVSGLPSQYMKEGEKISRKKAEVEVEIHEREQQIADQKKEQQKLDEQRAVIEKERVLVERYLREFPFINGSYFRKVVNSILINFTIRTCGTDNGLSERKM